MLVVERGVYGQLSGLATDYTRGYCLGLSASARRTRHGCARRQPEGRCWINLAEDTAAQGVMVFEA